MIDIAATVLDAAGLPHPTFVHGVQQMPLHGKSMVPSFAEAEAPEHRETQTDMRDGVILRGAPGYARS